MEPNPSLTTTLLCNTCHKVQGVVRLFQRRDKKHIPTQSKFPLRENVTAPNKMPLWMRPVSKISKNSATLSDSESILSETFSVELASYEGIFSWLVLIF
ncbi:hypothetical protein [Collimonas sp. OK242]|uniref:hypothetical protein n=1 Tax=Collimonas sp. OK242 TaxID=1798195 RepID=UPI00115F84A9|nr:hypothetical protein [Collimonas sp. OK242]